MKILAIDPTDTWARACLGAAARHGHRVDLAAGLPSADQVHAQLVEAIITPLPADAAAWSRLRQIREQAPALLIVVLVAKAERGVVDPALDAGASDVLLQHVPGDELMLRLRCIHELKALASPGVLSARDLRIDLAHRQATRGGRKLQLTPTEWRIVEVLMRADGGYIGADAIAAVLPQRDAVPPQDPANRVSVHISNLRRKLGAATVQSRRGMGYQLGA